MISLNTRSWKRRVRKYCKLAEKELPDAATVVESEDTAPPPPPPKCALCKTHNATVVCPICTKNGSDPSSPAVFCDKCGEQMHRWNPAHLPLQPLKAPAATVLVPTRGFRARDPGVPRNVHQPLKERATVQTWIPDSAEDALAHIAAVRCVRGVDSAGACGHSNVASIPTHPPHAR